MAMGSDAAVTGIHGLNGEARDSKHQAQVAAISGRRSASRRSSCSLAVC